MSRKTLILAIIVSVLALGLAFGAGYLTATHKKAAPIIIEKNSVPE